MLAKLKSAGVLVSACARSCQRGRAAALQLPPWLRARSCRCAAAAGRWRGPSCGSVRRASRSAASSRRWRSAYRRCRLAASTLRVRAWADRRARPIAGRHRPLAAGSEVAHVGAASSAAGGRWPTDERSRRRARRRPGPRSADLRRRISPAARAERRFMGAAAGVRQGHRSGPLGHADGRSDGAGESIEATLARETAEEAGLDSLTCSVWRARPDVTVRRPVAEGYMDERIAVFRAAAAGEGRIAVESRRRGGAVRLPRRRRCGGAPRRRRIHPRGDPRSSAPSSPGGGDRASLAGLQAAGRDAPRAPPPAAHRGLRS